MAQTKTADIRQVANYEHAAQIMAVRRLLEGKRFKNALVVGAPEGKLSDAVGEFADSVVSVAASKDTVTLAAADASLDVAVLVRTLHYVQDTGLLFSEVARVLKDDGYAIMEVANYTHARNRLKYLLRRKKIPTEPLALPAAKHSKETYINHNPDTVRKQLAHTNLKVERILSVSNLQGRAISRFTPKRILLAIEGILQPTLANSYFGPSVFFLVHKEK